MKLFITPRIKLVALLMASIALMAAVSLAADENASEATQSQKKDDVQALADGIDKLIAADWKASQVTPVNVADDAEFMRRVYLDVAGKIPAVADARDFLDDKTAGKHRRLVDRLLDGPNYVANSTNLWRTVLMPEADSDLQIRFLLPGFEAWLRRRLTADVAYDDIVREILTTPLQRANPYATSGNVSPIAFYQAKETKPENLAAATSRMFLGIRIECAQCHDHPFDQWKREDFWGYATFFAAMQRRPSNNGFFGQLQELFSRRRLRIPYTGETVSATFLNGQKARIPSGSSARITLANWITAKDNPYFARTAANRLWGHFFGTGIVDPVDDFSESNPPSHPELLDVLAEQLVSHDFDLKFLIRAITASRTYQLTSAIQPGKPTDDVRLFSRMAEKGLTAEQLYDSIAQAVGLHETFDANARARFGQTSRGEFIERFTDIRSKPTERQTTVLQALSLMNGQLVHNATQLNTSKTLASIVEFPRFDTSQRIEALFLATLSRKPRAAELARFVTYVDLDATKDDSKQALSDVFWALLNSSEFSSNH